MVVGIDIRVEINITTIWIHVSYADANYGMKKMFFFGCLVKEKTLS